MIPGQWCEDCEMDGDQTQATQEWDAHCLDSGGLFLCERCADRRQEASCEPDYDAMGSTERCQLAWQQKRELERK